MASPWAALVAIDSTATEEEAAAADTRDVTITEEAVPQVNTVEGITTTVHGPGQITMAEAAVGAIAGKMTVVTAEAMTVAATVEEATAAAVAKEATVDSVASVTIAVDGATMAGEPVDSAMI